MAAAPDHLSFASWLQSGVLELWEAICAPVDPQSFLFAPYVATALVIGLVVLHRQGGSGALWSRLFPRQIYLHRSTRHDLLLYAFDRVALVLLFVPRLAFAVAIANVVSGSAAALVGPLDVPIVASRSAIAAYTLSDVLVTDLALFLTHYLAHRIGLLWSFHKVHHSAPVLTPMTAKRFHPLEVVEDQLMMDVANGVVIGLGHYLSSGTLSVYTVLWVNVVDFFWNLTGANLRHSHVWLAYPPWLSRIIVSPAMHQLHHSRQPQHYDKNFGNVFAFWDGIAGTLEVARERQQLQFGLGEQAEGHDSFWGLLGRPFVDVWACCRAFSRRTIRRDRES